MRSSTSTLEVIDLLPAHRFRIEPLERYLAGRLAPFEPPLSVLQFQGGMSNPTFALKDQAGRSWVMRKKPPGELLPSAHAVDREYRVISALGETDVPVPRTHLLCEDETIIGTAFYVMEHVVGRVFLDPQLPELNPSGRAAVYDEMNRALAALHRVDFKAVGLEGFGREDGYCERQHRRWSRQYVATKTEEVPEMDRLMSWLPDHMPAEEATRVVHGDYRLGNMVFHPSEPKILAVLDWELSTLGQPLADLAYSCLPYHARNDAIGDLVDAPLDDLGIPSESAFVARYRERTGRSELPTWTFFQVLSLFRLAAITQGVYYRGVQGNASDPRALDRKGSCERLAKIAWNLVETRF